LTNAEAAFMAKAFHACAVLLQSLSSRMR
jgi:hypothetical protein